MSCYKARVRRLEERQRRRCPPGQHFVSIVRVPWDVDEDDQDRWLREEVTSACGCCSCPELQIGAMLPEKAPSAEA
jgi:hypothetical protein